MNRVKISSLMNPNLPVAVRCLPSSFWTMVFLLTTLTWSTVDAAIDFTPVPGERNQEGIIFKQLVFREKERKITYQHPDGWSYVGDSKRLRLNPPNVAQAQADIEQAALRTPQPIDEAALRDQAMTALPPGSLKATIVTEEQNPLQINRHDTYGVTINYVLHGQEYMANILFANLDDTQLRFRFVARKQDFEKLFRAFRGSLFLLQWTEEPRAKP